MTAVTTTQALLGRMILQGTHQMGEREVHPLSCELTRFLCQAPFPFILSSESCNRFIFSNVYTYKSQWIVLIVSNTKASPCTTNGVKWCSYVSSAGVGGRGGVEHEAHRDRGPARRTRCLVSLITE